MVFADKFAGECAESLEAPLQTRVDLGIGIKLLSTFRRGSLLLLDTLLLDKGYRR